MRIVLCGDTLFSSRNLAKRLDQRIVNILQGADAVFANAEFSTPKDTTPPGLCMFLTSVRPETLDELVDLNIRLVSFANNHTIDYGWQGVLDTMDAARQRGLIACGVGRNLDEARKAKFLDTEHGRIGVVATNSTWSERALASNANADVVARPGLAPLRWGRSYVLPEQEFEQIKRIDEMLGTKRSMLEVSKVETWAIPGEDKIKFGSPMEGNLLIERGERAYVKTFVNEGDQEALLRSIHDAAQRSDVVLATLHTHEGMTENWYDDMPPTFVEEFAHKAIDAGATVFVGHGAHFCRGVEIYKGHPIFYNLGSLLMEFESGESMISPEMYNTYGLPGDAYPSDLHGGRAQNKKGEWTGFYSERRFSTNYFVIMDVDDTTGEASYQIVPIDLDMRRENHLKRGLPEMSSAEDGLAFSAELTRMSEKYSTKFIYNRENGMITMQ